MQDKIVLFDIDYTLLNTTKLKELILAKLKEVVPSLNFELLDEIYYEVRKFGSFDPKLFAKLFKDKHKIEILEIEIEKIWYDSKIIGDALYPEVIETLNLLQKRQNLTLGIFSSGRQEFQLQKIYTLSDFFTKEYIHIFDFKEDSLSDLMREYESKSVVLVDDFISILQNGKKYKEDLSTIWMKRGKFAEKAVIPTEFTPDYTITNLSEVLDILPDMNLTNTF
ncbi:MAG TPA: HAD hydrolase-like protein [Patescibacteria group bacterium]